MSLAEAKNDWKTETQPEFSPPQVDNPSHRESSSVNDDDGGDEIMKREKFRQEKTPGGSAREEEGGPVEQVRGHNQPRPSRFLKQK